jgi:hypothetical protein
MYFGRKTSTVCYSKFEFWTLRSKFSRKKFPRTPYEKGQRALGMGPLLKCKIVIAKNFETLVNSPAVKIGGKKVCF